MHLYSSLARSRKPNFLVTHHDDFDDEFIANKATNSLILMLNNSSRPMNDAKVKIDDYATMLETGMIFPLKDRITFRSFVDLKNDVLPERFCIDLSHITKQSKKCNFYSSTLVGYKDRGSKAVSKAAGKGHTIYRLAFIDGLESLSKSCKKEKDDSFESLTTIYYGGVAGDGCIYGMTESGAFTPIIGEFLSYGIGLYNDSRYFWNVCARERFSEELEARVIFPVDESHVKSLFYARSVPMTASGRLRPILHWVQCHKRRIQKGIDIDIKQHLRGITEFVMHDVSFEITQPLKNDAK